MCVTGAGHLPRQLGSGEGLCRIAHLHYGHGLQHGLWGIIRNWIQLLQTNSCGAVQSLVGKQRRLRSLVQVHPGQLWERELPDLQTVFRDVYQGRHPTLLEDHITNTLCSVQNLSTSQAAGIGPEGHVEVRHSQHKGFEGKDSNLGFCFHWALRGWVLCITPVLGGHMSGIALNVLTGCYCKCMTEQHWLMPRKSYAVLYFLHK